MNKAEWFSGILTKEQQEENVRIVEFSYIPSRLGQLLKLYAPDALDFCVNVDFNTATTAYFGHWSRCWEYSWVVLNGGFQNGLKILDAGGAGSILPYRLNKIVNGNIVILDRSELKQKDTFEEYGDGIEYVVGDIGKLPFSDCAFDRVVCTSVLEHCENPLDLVKELWRVVSVGGRLLLTIDVIFSEKTINNSIDLDVLDKILKFLSLEVDPTKTICAADVDGSAIGVLGVCCSKN